MRAHESRVVCDVSFIKGVDSIQVECMLNIPYYSAESLTMARTGSFPEKQKSAWGALARGGDWFSIQEYGFRALLRFESDLLDKIRVYYRFTLYEGGDLCNGLIVMPCAKLQAVGTMFKSASC